MRRGSVAMTEAIARGLNSQLLRPDGQEDICLAIYLPSTGRNRDSALVSEILLPRDGERLVHGNATVTGDYVVRAAVAAVDLGGGVVLLHSHPHSHGWQGLSRADFDAESSYSYLVHRMTGLPLVGMTLAGGDLAWSARRWSEPYRPEWCENVRVVGPQLKVTWNDDLRPPPVVQASQLRTVSGWGDEDQANLVRLRVLVVGAGSVGLDIGPRLAASGIENVAVMDFDSVEMVNLDRMIGASSLDVLLHRSKVEVASRLVSDASTAEHSYIETFDLSVCEVEGHAIALDYDVIFSCVDRPWPRAVLNQLAYSDLIPVIDGGLSIDPFVDGGMRNATWRSHVVYPGRPCLSCNRQLDLGSVGADRDGLLDDPDYIAGAGDGALPPRQNVAMLAISVTAGLLAQFVSLIVAPGGRGEPGPLQYMLSTHDLEHLQYESGLNCVVEAESAVGDSRVNLTDAHARAGTVRMERETARKHLWIRSGLFADRLLFGVKQRLTALCACLVSGD